MIRADFRHISIGVDIGIGGGVSRLDESGALLGVDDIPVLADGPAGRRAINAPLLAELIANSRATRAFVEYVGARPGEGAVGAFAFGRSRGVVEGVLGALGVPIRFLTPPAWKRTIGLAPCKDGAKDAARAEAIRRWPAHAALVASTRYVRFR
jgi:hypothetical protein